MGAVQLERIGVVALPRLDRPGNRYALRPEDEAGLSHRLPALMDDGVGRIVSMGTGGALCAGGDIANMDDCGAREHDFRP